MSRKRTLQTRARTPSGTQKPDGLYWHPDVHRQFGEELFFFLIQTKPFDEHEAFGGLKAVMTEFGVSAFCAYQLFGDFDILVRVWLPLGQYATFVERLVAQVKRLHSINRFHVTSIRDIWRFPASLSDEAKANLAFLSGETIQKVEHRTDADTFEDFRRKNLITVVEDFGRSSPAAVKAFIALSEPEGHSLVKGKKVLEEIASLIERRFSFQQPTIYEGVGFSWILIKLVAPGFYDIGQLVHELSERFGADGVSTRTFLVGAKNYREGECISRRAIESREGDASVRLLIPSLYTASKLALKTKDEIERFVRVNILNKELEAQDKLALQGFLNAVIKDNYIEAYTAIFPSFVQAEQELRALLIEQAKTLEGNIMGLVRRIDPSEQYIKSPRTMTLSYVLRGCQVIADALARPTDDLQRLWTLKCFDSIGNYRNRVMHGAEFDCGTEWAGYAEAVVNLSILKKYIVTLLKPI
jgi:hypothetical protein